MWQCLAIVVLVAVGWVAVVVVWVAVTASIVALVAASAAATDSMNNQSMG